MSQRLSEGLKLSPTKKGWDSWACSVRRLKGDTIVAFQYLPVLCHQDTCWALPTAQIINTDQQHWTQYLSLWYAVTDWHTNRFCAIAIDLCHCHHALDLALRPIFILLCCLLIHSLLQEPDSGAGFKDRHCQVLKLKVRNAVGPRSRSENSWNS